MSWRSFRDTLLEWARTYPRDYLPHTNGSTCYRFVGQFEKAVREARQGLDLAPDNVGAAYTLMIGYIRMERLDEAKKVYEEARARNLDSPYLHYGRYLVAFLEHDDANMLDLVESAKGKPAHRRPDVGGAGSCAGLPREVEASPRAVGGSDRLSDKGRLAG